MKKIMIAIALAAFTLAGTANAGGRGGAELGIASYNGGIGFVGSLGAPIRSSALSNNGLNAYGELELGVGFLDEVSVGGDVSLGLLFPLIRGLSMYGSLGGAIGADPDVDFGLAAEVGLNVRAGRQTVFLEGGVHTDITYFVVGLHF